jgi:hypothetical protein
VTLNFNTTRRTGAGALPFPDGRGCPRRMSPKAARIQTGERGR